MSKIKGLWITIRPKIGIVTFPWVGAMALFASVEYGEFLSPIYSDPIFYIKLILIMIASYLGVTSGYAVNDYFDAEMDLVSTKRVDKAVRLGTSPKDLLTYSALLGIPSLIIMFYLSIFMGIIGIIQMLCILVYSKVLKRKNAYANFFVVLPTAIMPFGVFFAYTNQITIEASLLFIINFFYEPGFTWSGTCRDVEGDKKEGIPTLPLRYGIKAVAKFILACWIILLIASIALFLFTNLGLVYLIGSILAATLLIWYAINLIKKPIPGIAMATFFKSSRWFWHFSFFVIIDVLIGISGFAIPNINLI
jgi:4-hydroxybenzoate polyprenyltransferase